MLASSAATMRPISASISASSSTAGARLSAPRAPPRLCALRRGARPAVADVVVAASAASSSSSSSLLCTRRRRTRPLHHPPAAGKGDAPTPAPLSDETKKRFDAMLAQLRSTGLDQEKARRLLKAWAKAGALEPEALKALLVRRALTPAAALGTQAAIDGLAAAGGFLAGAAVSGAGDELPFKIFLQTACYFAGMWYAISGAAGLSALVQVLLAARRYASSADALLAAVQVLAGEASSAAGSGNVAANVALAVNTAKVVAALDAIAGQLRAMDGSGAGGGGEPLGASSLAAQRSTLVSLAAFLVLQQAEEKAGFVPAEYGLTEGEAGEIAAVFSVYDKNENFVLDVDELGDMCRELGRELTDGEAKEAGRILAAAAADGGGAVASVGDPRGVTFPAFVRWWTGRGPAAAGDKAEREAPSAA